MLTFHDLPKPQVSELERSHSLSEKIKNEINLQGGFISFSTFMKLALYQPKLGYYQAENITLGKAGDFTTAPEISPLFAKCFALQCKEIWRDLDQTERQLLELGAGTGQFAKDILEALEVMNCLPTHYYIYEQSESLKQKQKLLFQSAPALAKHVTWLDTLPSHFKGIIFANEVLDALPVHCFTVENNEVKERGVCFSSDNNQFVFENFLPTTSVLTESVLKLFKRYEWSMPYVSEINLELPAFIKQLSEILEEGIILFADYGYPENIYYHPDRHQGTLMSFHQHRQYHHPLWYPGLFDITAHVNFTQVAESAVDVDLDVLGFTTQASFLLACGLIDFAKNLEKNLSPTDEFDLHQAIKLLTFPSEMGERIKIMALGRGKASHLSLRGFNWHDRRRDL